MEKSKKIILTADDFGMKTTRDEAIKDCFLNGFLTSACICANGESYLTAIKEVLPKCVKNGRKMDLGVHLDLIEGFSLTNCPRLTHKNKKFKHGFISLLIHSFSKSFLKEAEQELKAQTELITSMAREQGFKVSFINSHIHFHAIPNIFNIVKKIAHEYDIPFIRTQKEIPALLNEIKPINYVKVAVLWILNLFNKTDFTNDYIMGVAHTAKMTPEAIYQGLERLLKYDCLIEILLHPDCDIQNASGYLEYQTILDKELEFDIQKSGYNFTSVLDLYNGDSAK